MLRIRTRVAAAIGGFGLIVLSMLGLGVAAQAAPPLAAVTPSIIGSPPDGNQTTDLTPPIEFSVNTDTDLEVQVYADGSPYCFVGSTGTGFSISSCSGTALPLGNHSFTAIADYAGGPSIPSGTSNSFDILIYDNSPVIIVGSPGGITTDSTPSWNGEGPAGGTLTIYNMSDPGNPWCVVPIAMDSTWVCSSRPLPPANYTAVRASGTSIVLPGGSFTTTSLDVQPPVAPVIQDTFGPGWISGYDQPTLNGDKIGTDLVEVHIQISQDDVAYSPYCDLVGEDPLTNLWFNCTPTSAALQLGTNYLRATVVNEAGITSPVSAALQIQYVQSPVITFPTPGYVTNDATPQFEVSNAFGTTGQIWDVGADSVLCGAPIVGNEFSCSPAADLPDGTYTVFAGITPGTGVSSPSQSITIDTVAPAAGTITDPVTPAATTNVTPTISGTAEVGSSTNILVDGDPNACVSPAIADAFGNWRCWLVTPLTLGPHNFETTTVDVGGNSSPLSGIQLVLTVGLPSATITPVFSPWYTASDFVQVQGTNSDDPVVITVERADNPGGPWTPYCSVDYDVPQGGLNVWFCNEFSGPGQQGTLELGSNYLRARVQVAGGAMSPPSAPILIQRIPAPTISSPNEGAVIHDRTPTFTGTAPPEASFVDVALAAEVAWLCENVPVQADNTWSCTSSIPLADGPYSVYVGTDVSVGAGPYGFSIDANGPPFPVIDIPASPAVTADTTPTIGGSSVPGSEVTVWLNGTPASCGTGSFQPNGSGRWACVVGPLTAGQYQVAASATDSYGNSAGPSAPQLLLTIDPFAPTPVLLVLNWKLGALSGSYLPGDAVAITGTGLPVGAEANAEIHSTPEWVGSAVTDQSGAFVIDAVIPEDIEPGEHLFVVTVTAEGAEPSTIEQPVTIMAPPVPPKAAADTAIEKNQDAGAGGGAEYLGDRNEPATPSVMTTSLDTILQILGNPVFIITAGVAGLALLLFVAIPAELLNATLSEHYDRITKRIPRTNAGWWTRMKGLLASTPVVGGVIITVLAAIVFGFADPGFGFDLVSLRVVLACAIGLFFVGFIANLVTGAIVGRRWHLDTVMELKPLGLLLAIIGVVLSRLLDFSPGLLIGLLIGISLLGRVSKADESRTALVKTGVVWGLGILAWVGYSLLAGPLVGTSFAGNLTVETMVAATAEGLTALLIGLLPFKFLEGSAIWDHNKALWAAVWLGAAASWVLIVLPQNYGEIQGSIWVWSAIVAGFAVVALAIYLVFRFAVKPEPEDAESESDTQKVRIGSGR
jgi:hypothetical protein